MKNLPETSPPPLLSLVGVEVRYGAVVAVTGVDLEIQEPCLLALLGPSGCGKTSLLRAIAGFEVPTAGTLRIDGVVVADGQHWVPAERRHVGMVFQQGALFPHLRVWDNVLYGVEGHPDGEDRAREALALVGLGDLGGRYPDELSGGQQQRVALARALAPSPKMVLLDEPFANLDAGLRVRVREEVRGILQAAGTAAVLVTHDQEEALSIADRVAVMHDGRILQVGSPETIYHSPATLAVASFLGDGQLVACSVEGGRAHCVYGTAVTDAPDGDGNLFVRPEDLVIRPATVDPPRNPPEDGLLGRVQGRTFFGHDLLTMVEFPDGAVVPVRQLSSAGALPGAPVRVGLRSKAFPVFGAGATIPAS